MRDLQHGLVGVGGYVRAVRTWADRRGWLGRGQLNAGATGLARNARGWVVRARDEQCMVHGVRVRDHVFGVLSSIISRTGA